jgi:hypothetical protein
MTTLRLGDFTFARGEVPESIGFGASQQLHVHTLVGGARVIDALGAVPQRQEWSGWFVGPQALARARYLKQLTEAGQPLPLSYGEFAYIVVIAAFSAEFRAGPNLPYSITLEVVSDLGAAGAGAGMPGLTQVIAQDLAGAAANAAAIGDSGLIAAVGAVAGAVAAGSDATPASAAAQARAAGLNGAASAQIAALGALASPDGGGNPVGPEALSQFGAGLAAAAGAVQQSCRLNATIQGLGRMTTNLQLGGGGGLTLTTGSTDLYHLAAAAYGDARGWTRIAQANRLTDPAISGITQLVIPPADAVPATGVLNG